MKKHLKLNMSFQKYKSHNRVKHRMKEHNYAYSLSISATGHLYCAVENRQMSAYCRTKTSNKVYNVSMFHETDESHLLL